MCPRHCVHRLAATRIAFSFPFISLVCSPNLVISTYILLIMLWLEIISKSVEINQMKSPLSYVCAKCPESHWQAKHPTTHSFPAGQDYSAWKATWKQSSREGSIGQLPTSSVNRKTSLPWDSREWWWLHWALRKFIQAWIGQRVLETYKWPI